MGVVTGDEPWRRGDRDRGVGAGGPGGVGKDSPPWRVRGQVFKTKPAKGGAGM